MSAQIPRDRPALTPSDPTGSYEFEILRRLVGDSLARVFIGVEYNIENHPASGADARENLIEIGQGDWID